MPSSDLQPILDELSVMRGLIELLSPLPPDTRHRVLAWLYAVISQEAAPGVMPAWAGPLPPTSAPSAPGPSPPRDPRSAAGARLAERIEQLSRGDVPPEPVAAVAATVEEKSRVTWRNKHA